MLTKINLKLPIRNKVYIRTDDIDNLYQPSLDKKVNICPSRALQTKPWAKEFSMLDPDHNLLTFKQSEN